MPSAHWRQTGGIWPLGVSTSLTWYDFGALLTIIQRYGIRTAIEIGVEHGGLAALLSSYGRYSTLAYRGIDISLRSLAPAVRQNDEPRLIERDAWRPATIAEVGNWLEILPAPALIFCDGGDKPKELRLYAPLLRRGDVLAGHDYHNEYVDDALVGLPDDLIRLTHDWLADTLICAFTRGLI